MNWRRGFAEVAFIFVGITLALFFDNWNEARTDWRILEAASDLYELQFSRVAPSSSAQLRPSGSARVRLTS
jgi:hypothetical protein